MKNFLKGKFGTVIILFFTLILAGVAIFTALRLYQLRQQSVAPNVPSSNPFAQEVTPSPTPGACTLTFTITPASPTPTPSPGLICESKTAWLNDSRNAPPVYYLTTNIATGAGVTAGQKFVYKLIYKNTGTTTVNSAVFTDILPTQVDFVDAGSGCTYNSGTRTVTCDLGNVLVNGRSARAIRVIASTTASSGSFTNTATLSATGVENSECQIALNIQTSTGSPTATPTATPTGTATATPTATPTPSGTPNSCGGTCGSNTNCGGGLYCYLSAGFCRNPSCPTQTDCNCPGTSTPTPTVHPTGTSAPTPTPTAPALPASGTDWPTIVGAGVGIFVILGSLLLAL